MVQRRLTLDGKAWDALDCRITSVYDVDTHHIVNMVVKTRKPWRYAHLRRNPTFIAAWVDKVVSRL